MMETTSTSSVVTPELPLSPIFQFGAFRFDPRSGELRSGDPADDRVVTRLPPQPARLLELLAERRGEVLGRDEVRAALWPDVEVDFDQGLTFCVRQVRTALGDSARSPTYVETLPRRGYRLLPEVRLLEGAEADRAGGDGAGRERGAPAASRPVGRDGVSGPQGGAQGGSGASAWTRLGATRGVVWLAAAALVVALLGWPRQGESTALPRLAVMPFPEVPQVPQPRTSEAPASTPALSAVGEELMLRLAQRRDAEIVGPRTTGRFDPDAEGLLAMSRELDLDYVLNGRLLPADTGGLRLLVELIRFPDGAHVWVESFDLPGETGEIPGSSLDGVVSTLAVAARGGES